MPTTGARFGVLLVRAVPLGDLLNALTKMRGRRGPEAVVLTAREGARGDDYREHLELDGERRVVKILRSFGNIGRRERLLGVLWKTDDSAALNGPCWRTVRRILREKRRTQRTLLEMRDAADWKSDVVGRLTPDSLRNLARDLGYQEVREFCFAGRGAQVSEEALLRGPLFIEDETVIGAEHVHVGPGWVTPESQEMTFPEGGSGIGGAYFVGPRTERRPVYDAFKRIFDVVFALCAIVATLPICIMTALLIKAYDRGPVLFVHRREGLGGKVFGCLKFRTMVRDADALQKKLRAANQVDGPQFKLAYDPRVTPMGNFLRRTNIDELPQFWNVLRGEMSVVGPRPSPHAENQLCPGWREARLSVRPGITGLWQISRSRERGAADFQEWIFYDTQYVERRNFWLDVKIVLLTIKELFGKGQ